MIINQIINFIVLCIGILFTFFPVVHLSNIPIIGGGITGILVGIIQTWNAFLITFPYAQIVWHIFLYLIIPFEISIILLRFFFGNRLPLDIQ